MINSIKKIIKSSLFYKVFTLYNVKLDKIDKKIDNSMILMGNILNQKNISIKSEILENIQKSEFKIFSQWGDDGIIQFLINYLDVQNKTFVEFGVQNYEESNTRFLLINNNWKGLVIDSSSEYINYIRNSEIYWKYNLVAHKEFITKKNINKIILENGFKDEIGLLHIDIDGNDYWIWEEINIINPIIVIVEYNSLFGDSNAWTIPYIENFYRTDYHYSNLYRGSSLLSLCDLAEKKGYYFVGSNSNGNNAYYIRKDKISDLKTLTTKEGYMKSEFRESRDENGKLTYLSNEQGLSLLKGMKIFDTRKNMLEEI